MPIQLTPRNEQLLELATLRDLGAETLQKIIDKLSGLDIAIKPAEIQQGLQEVLPESPKEVLVLMNLLMSLYTLQRQRNLTVDELLDSLGIFLSQAWKDDEFSRWNNLKPLLLSLFSLTPIKIIVKALDLSYDYSYLLQNAKILTDIRPIFNEDASAIQGAVVSYTLRLYFGTLEGKRESLSLALDEEDVKQLSEICNRALKKAQTAKSFMEKGNVKKTFIAGEEES